MTLQRRMLGYLVLAAIASCALTVGVAAVLVRHRISSQRLAVLAGQANALTSVAELTGTLPPGDHVYLVVSGNRPRLVGRALGATILAAIPRGNSQGTIEVAGRGLLYAARVNATGRIVLVRSSHLAFGDWRPFLSSLLLAGVGGALLALLLSYLLARRLTRPIGTLASATRRVAAGDPAVSVPVRGEDELADLGRAFNEMSTELATARESQRSFLESVSHELKTPLTSIRGYAEALQEGAVGSAEGARVIGAEADRLERLVLDLLDLARLGRAGFTVARDPVDLGEISRHAVERHLPQARELGVALVAGGANGARAIADEGRLLQATSNLIENALRLTPPGGSVVVDVAPGEISVRDTGPGLAPDDLPHAFERFYLYDRYRSERPVGSGLGLTIVAELVRAMGGAVQATNQESGGAAFTISLPTVTAAGPPTPRPPRSSPPGAAQPSA